MSAVEWGELPESHPKTVWDRISAELKSRPGEWAKVRSYSSPNSATNSAVSARKRCPELEIVRRGADLWARWREDAA